MIADEAARDCVAIRGASAIRVDVRLDRESLAGMEPIGELASDGDDGDRGLVTESRRMRREILTVELRMLAAEADQLHVRETEPHRIDAHEDLILRRGRNVDLLGSTIAPDVFDALPVHVPGERAARRLWCRVIGLVRLVRLGHFARGRSAALSTRPVGSRMPTFVDIVSGLAVKRSPAFIATQRYP